MKNIPIALIAMAALLGACDTVDQAGKKQTISTIAGAVLGGYFGSKIGMGEGRLWAAGAGAALGAVIGSELGKSLDENDRNMMERTSQAALEHTRTGSTSTWRNPDTGHSGTVTPTRTYQQSSGTYCRDLTQTVEIDGQTQTATGAACRQPDGSWRITN